MPSVLKYCLQKNSIACANERIPRRARKSAFLGIVHFAHGRTFLNSHSSLKHIISQFYTLARNSLLPRQGTRTILRIKTLRIKILKNKPVPLSFLLSGTILHFISPPFVLKEEIASPPSARQFTLWETKGSSAK